MVPPPVNLNYILYQKFLKTNNSVVTIPIIMVESVLPVPGFMYKRIPLFNCKSLHPCTL